MERDPLKSKTEGKANSSNKLENEKTSSLNYQVIDAKIIVPERLIHAIDVLCRIADRERDDLLSYLIVCQLEWMQFNSEHIINLMKDKNEFFENLEIGTNQCQKIENLDKSLKTEEIE